MAKDSNKATKQQAKYYFNRKKTGAAGAAVGTRKNHENPAIGMNTLKESWFDIAIYVSVMIVIFGFHPPLWATLLLISNLVLVKQLYHKTFTIKGYLTSLATLGVFFGLIQILYRYIGGLWAIIITHVLGCSLMIWGARDFIKQADQQIKAQLQVIIDKKKRGENDG